MYHSDGLPRVCVTVPHPYLLKGGFAVACVEEPSQIQESFARLYVMNYKEREELAVDLPGAEGTTVRWLIGRSSGAQTYAMRLFEVKPGSKIPIHSHAEEHEIFVLDGEAQLLGAQEPTFAKKDDVVFIPPNMSHGYDNTNGKRAFRFICVIPLLEKK